MVPGQVLSELRGEVTLKGDTVRLRDWLTVGLVVMVLVLWTEYAYNRGVQAANYQCEWESSV